MSERQILITITEDLWSDDDQEWLLSDLDGILHGMMSRRDYTIQEFTK